MLIKKFKKSFWVPVALIFVGILLGYFLPRDFKPMQIYLPGGTPKSRPAVAQTDEQKSLAEENKYIVDIPSKYFDGNLDTSFYNKNTILKGFFINEMPQPISQDNEIKIISEDFSLKKICGNNISCKIRSESSFDVDGDGKEEQILYIPQGVNHGVENKYIIKDGKIIFKNLDAPSQITESKSHNGFYLTYYFDTFLAQPGRINKVRYIYEQGKFVPVWSQTSIELQTTQL